MTIYIGNISFTMTEEELEKTFAEFGKVASVKVITDKYSGKSKGFAFVDMENDGEGDAAVEALNGKDIGGRNVKVNKAYPKKEY
ncbi:MAG: RNA-binding protein [Bacteroidetes bacterium]|nr:RNA-binding protein [Bacteroidota bacterium]